MQMIPADVIHVLVVERETVVIILSGEIEAGVAIETTGAVVIARRENHLTAVSVAIAKKVTD